MCVLPTYQCSERPGRPRHRWGKAALVAALAGVSAQPGVAQVAVGRAAACPGGVTAVGDLGVDFDCQDCELSYQGSTQSWRWRFGSEPTIKYVGTSGPSRGKLRSGDMLVSIDGSLITTRSGGAKLAALESGRPVSVVVRRNGRDVTTEITPAAACPTESGVAVAALPRVAPVVVSPRQPRSPRPPPQPIGRGVTGVVAPLPPMVGTKAWFGFGLSCTDCMFYPVRQEAIASAEAQLEAQTQSADIDRDEVRTLYRALEAYRQEGSRWEFSENPRVFSVDEDGPADRAGLRRGDILTHIDGLALLSDEGGKRLGQVKSGEEVDFVYRRGTTVGTATLTASSEPSPRGLASERTLLRSQALLERSLSRIERTQDPAVRAEVVRLQEQLREAQAVQRVATVEAARAAQTSVRPLRYSGTIAQVNVTVRSHGSVVVSRDEDTGEVVITTSDATIRMMPEEGRGEGN